MAGTAPIRFLVECCNNGGRKEHIVVPMGTKHGYSVGDLLDDIRARATDAMAAGLEELWLRKGDGGLARLDMKDLVCSVISGNDKLVARPFGTARGASRDASLPGHSHAPRKAHSGSSRADLASATLSLAGQSQRRWPAVAAALSRCPAVAAAVASRRSAIHCGKVVTLREGGRSAYSSSYYSDSENGSESYSSSRSCSSRGGPRLEEREEDEADEDEEEDDEEPAPSLQGSRGSSKRERDDKEEPRQPQVKVSRGSI